MAPITRSQSKTQALVDTDKSGQSVEDGFNVTDKCIINKCVTKTSGVTGPNMGEADLNTAVLSPTDNISASEHPNGGPTAVMAEKRDVGSGSCYIPSQDELACWESEIRETLLATTDDPSTLFINIKGWMTNDCGVISVMFYYSCNGECFIIRDNGQPWRWPEVKVDPATLGLPYDPETNAEDASLNLTVALPHTLLRNDTVFIKEFFYDCDGPTITKASNDLWRHEVRMLELLAKKHPHPNIVRYLGCRVIEVPGDATDTATEDVPGHAGQKHKRVHKRITGIVLEKAPYCMQDYDPDDDNWSRILEPAIFLKRLEAVVLYLHSVGLAHNDLKPGNVMVRADGQPVLIDFQSCAPLGAKLETAGTENWSMAGLCQFSRVENDLYALRLFRERIGDKDARESLKAARASVWPSAIPQSCTRAVLLGVDGDKVAGTVSRPGGVAGAARGGSAAVPQRLVGDRCGSLKMAMMSLAGRRSGLLASVELSADGGLARSWCIKEGSGDELHNSSLLRATLAPQVAVDYSNIVAAWGIKHYTADEFAALWLSEEHLGLPVLATQHLLGQPLFKSVTDKEIVVRWQQLASHGRKTATGPNPNGGPPVVSETSDGRTYMEHRFEKQADGRWKIASITPSMLYTTGDFMRIRRPVGAE